MTRAKQLAADHLAWVAGYNRALGLTEIPLAAAEYLYRTATEHGYGHGAEDERNGAIQPPDLATVPPDLIPAPLNLDLPAIALECTAEDARAKYHEERGEWLAAGVGTIDELIEAWDALQAARTWQGLEPTLESGLGYHNARCQIELSYTSGRDVMAAKAAMLLKNAKRGYYAPEVNAAIIASNGASFTPNG